MKATTLDDGLQEIVDRTVREINRAKIQKPKRGQTVRPCHYSKTGHAIADKDGNCTCKPARFVRGVNGRGIFSVGYPEFLSSKQVKIAPSGFSVPSINSKLFEFQRDVALWSLNRGKSALFEDCGLGKTPQQLVWADEVSREYKRPVLILAPLAVAKQTEREGRKFDVDCKIAASDMDIRGKGVYVTNYEKLQHFDPARFAGIVLDESSILKSFTGATRNLLIELFNKTPMKLCCTATPAPNDFMELGSHSEFLGVLTRTEMLSTFFVHDGGETAKWRLKGHAEEEYWKWICEWAVMIRKPSDLGYSDDGFALPPLTFHHHIVDGRPSEGFLFQVEASTLNERRQARRASLEDRARMLAEIVAQKPNEPWLIWCDLNDEGDLAEKLIPNAIQVAGRHSDEQKEDRMIGFSEGRYQILISKPSIAGWGMNWQHCSNVVFLGLSDSWEQYYQAIRRCWRFGQKNQVDCHIITSKAEGAVVKNIERKEHDALKMAKEMVKHMSVYNKAALHKIHEKEIYTVSVEKSDRWEIRLGDCVEGVKSMPDSSVHYSIFSPPFQSLYTYSPSERDMGNTRSDEEFAEHFQYLVEELYRVLMPGRMLSFHCMLLPSSKERDGVIGLKNFRDKLIRMFCGGEALPLIEAKRILLKLGRDTSEIDRALEDAQLKRGGFIHHSEAIIWKDPVSAMQRTKAIGLLHKQLVKDSCMSRQGIPDFLVTMRKPGVNPERVAGVLDRYVGDDETLADTRGKWKRDEMRDSINIWQRYASPIWMDINPSDTLQRESAREEKDERHICPLQLQVIERGLQLWTNPNDLVYSPFAGIGSEGYVALKLGRRFVGDELKQSYWKQAVANCRRAENMAEQDTLFAATA